MRGELAFSAREGRDGLWAVTGYLLLFLFLLRGFAFLSAYLAEVGLGFLRYILSPLAYVIPLVIAGFCVMREKSTFFALPAKRAFADALPLLPLFLGSVMTTAYLSELLFDALGLSAVGGGVAGLGFLPDLALNCFLPALLEELFFRGLILSLLWRQMGGGGIWLSAIIFAISHGSLYQMPYAFVGGVFLALAAVLSGSVWLPFLFHFANNFLSLALEYTPRAWDFGGAVVLFAYAAVAALMVLSVVYLLSKKKTAAGDALTSLFALPREDWRSVLRAALLSPLTFYLVPMLIFSLWRAF